MWLTEMCKYTWEYCIRQNKKLENQYLVSLFKNSSPCFLKDIQSPSMDVGWLLVQFSVTMSSHCFRSAEAQALGRPIHNWQLQGHTCVFSYPGMILLYRKCVWCPAKKDLSHCRSDNQMVLHGGSKLTVFFCIRNSISFKKISITTGWNAAPYHDRASMMFYRYLKAVRNERWTENKWKRNTSRKPGELCWRPLQKTTL